MTEWLTTGQMIDRLKVGEVAKVEEYTGSGFFRHVTKTNEGLSWCHEDGEVNEGSAVYLGSAGIFKYKWRIIPKHVGFEEAKKAYEEGKTIKCEYVSAINSKEICKETFKKNLPEYAGSLSWHLILEGKWTIEE